MYTIILCAVLSAAIAFRARACKRKSERSIGDAIFCSFFSAMFGAIVGLIASMIVGAILVPDVDNVYGPARLVSVKSSEGLSGAFIWGSGSVSSDTYYHFYMADPDGSFVPQQVQASSVVHIVEDAKLKDEGFWTTTIREPDRSSPFYNWGVTLGSRTKAIRQEFRVPKGTVVQDFSITG